MLLSKRLVDAGVADASCVFVVFVSNARRQTPLWYQKAGHGQEGLVIWDYHVFVVEASHRGMPVPRAWDLDTTLPFPCPLVDYACMALRPVRAPYERWYRVVPAEVLWGHFASDRSHMRLPDGSWSAPPPPYPCFVAPDGCTNRLNEYLDVAPDSGGGDRGGGGSRSGSESGDGGGGLDTADNEFTGLAGAAAAGGDGTPFAEPLGCAMPERAMLRFFEAV